MRILLVFHGWFPTPGRPVAGGALRAWHHAEALRAAGHDVHLITRAQDVVDGGPPGFASAAELRAHAERIQPDALLVVQPEEAPALAPLGLPTVVDLYAPRLLEAQFQDATGVEAVNTLRAIQAGDFFLFSNHRQRHFFLGLLAMAGVDLRSQDFGAVVPLVATEGPERDLARSPLFVMGGVSWPWIDPTEALGRAVAHLRKRRKGKLLVLGHKPILGSSPVRDLRADLPPGPRLAYGGVLPYDELLATYAGAWAAIDMMASTPERDLAVAFRHMDYLGCGLPMIVGAEHVLAEPLSTAGAGLVGLGIEEAIDAVLDQPDALEERALAARLLARERFGREGCEAPLLAWLEAPRRRERRETPLGELAAINARAARAERGEQAALADLERIGSEIEAKRAEVAGLVEQSRVLGVATERLAGSVAEVAGFKREAIAVLGGAHAREREERAALQAKLATLEADVVKKEAELEGALREKGLVQDRLQDLRRQLAAADARIASLRTERDAATEARGAAAADSEKKSVEIDAQVRQQRLLEDQVGSLERRLGAADTAADALRTQVAAAESALAEARADSQKKSMEIDAFAGKQELLREQLGSLERRLVAADRAAATLREQVATAESALAEALADSQKKSVEIDAFAGKQELLREQLGSLERRLGAADTAADALRTQVATAESALAEARADSQKKSMEIDAFAGKQELLREQLGSLERRLVAADKAAATLREQVATAESALAEARGDSQKKSVEIDAFAGKQELLREQLGSLERRIVAADKAAATLREQVATAESALAEARADAEKKSVEIDAHARDKQALGSHLEELRRRQRDTRAEAVHLGGELARAAAALAELERDGAKKSSELAALARERDLLRERIPVLEDRIEQAHKEQRATQIELRKLTAAHSAAEGDAAKKGSEIEGLQLGLDRARATAAADRAALMDAAADAAKKGAELDALRTELANVATRFEAQQATLDQLRAAAAADAESLDDLRGDAVRKSAEIEALQASLDRARTRADAEASDARDARADAAKKGAECDGLRSELAGSANRMVALQATVDELRAAAAADAESLDNARADAAKKAAENEALQAALDRARMRADSEASAARGALADAAKKGAELDALRSELANVATRFEAQQATLDQLRAAAAADAESQDHARADAAKKAAEIEALQAALDRARMRADSEASAARDALADAAKKGAECDALRSGLANVATRFEAQQTTLDQLRAAAAAEAEALADARADAAKKGAEIEGLQQVLAQLRPQAEAATASLQEAQAARVRSEARLEATQQALDGLRAKQEADSTALQGALADAAKKAAELESLRLVLAQERGAAEHAQAELLALRGAGARLEAALSVGQQQLDQARAELESLRASCRDALDDAAVKGGAIAAMQQETDKLQGALERHQARAQELRDKLEQRAAELVRREEASGALLARAEALEVSLADAQADVDKKNAELEAAWVERERLEGVINELRAARR